MKGGLPGKGEIPGEKVWCHLGGGGAIRVQRQAPKKGRRGATQRVAFGGNRLDRTRKREGEEQRRGDSVAATRRDEGRGKEGG